MTEWQTYGIPIQVSRDAWEDAQPMADFMRRQLSWVAWRLSHPDPKREAVFAARAEAHKLTRKLAKHAAAIDPASMAEFVDRLMASPRQAVIDAYYAEAGL